LITDPKCSLDTSPGKSLDQSRTHYRILTYRPETNALTAPAKCALKFELKIGLTEWLPTLFVIAKLINKLPVCVMNY